MTLMQNMGFENEEETQKATEKATEQAGTPAPWVTPWQEHEATDAALDLFQKLAKGNDDGKEHEKFNEALKAMGGADLGTPKEDATEHEGAKILAELQHASATGVQPRSAVGQRFARSPEAASDDYKKLPSIAAKAAFRKEWAQKAFDKAQETFKKKLTYKDRM